MLASTVALLDYQQVAAVNLPVPRPLVIATRESPLAMWQAQHVQALLEQLLPQLDEAPPLALPGSDDWPA